MTDMMRFWPIVVALVAGVVGYAQLQARVDALENDLSERRSILERRIDKIEDVNSRLIRIEEKVDWLMEARRTDTHPAR